MTAAIVVLIAGCGGTNGGGGGGGTDACGGSNKGCILGSVQDSTGSPVGNATVSVAGSSTAGALSSSVALLNKASGSTITTANEQGWYTADEVSVGDRVICVSKTDYVEVCQTVSIEEGQITQIPIVKLKESASALTLTNAELGGTITDISSGGTATIEFPPNSVCDSSGSEVTGDIQCSLTTIDVENELDLVTPNFVAIRATGERGTMVSSAMMSVVCEQNGEELNICDGEEVTVQLPVFGTNCADDTRNEPTLDAWRYDPTTGVWQEYDLGTCDKTCGGTLDSQYYRCTSIDHLTMVNGDKYVEDACLTGEVLGATGGIGTSLVSVRCWGGGWSNWTQTDEFGRFCIPVPRGDYPYTCSVYSGNRELDPAQRKTGTTPFTEVQFPLAECPHPDCEDIGNFIFEQPLMTTTLVWGQNPSDLDSHFTNSGGGTHIYFSNKDVDNAIANILTKGSLTAEPYIMLDTDDTSSFGPEVTTVVYNDTSSVGVTDGTYRFCVRNFSGEEFGSLCDSEAMVVVQIPSKEGGVSVGQRYQVPTGSCDATTGNLLWQVYEVTIEDGVVTDYQGLGSIVESPSASGASSPCFE
jgi:hypothetical protein